VYFVASQPSIGREKATAILKSYQTPINALINIDDWEKAVHGLGPGITNRVKDVINTPYTENKSEDKDKECREDAKAGA
jgi:ERCC4-type nuclease